LEANLNPAPSGTTFSGNRLIATRLTEASQVQPSLTHLGPSAEPPSTSRNSPDALYDTDALAQPESGRLSLNAAG
jgi:hypothetical protein